MAARITPPQLTVGPGDPGWDAPEEEMAPDSAHPDNYRPMARPIEVTNLASLKWADREAFDAIELICTQLKYDMLPEEIQLHIIESMSASTKRALVSQMAGLDASVLVTFKQQLALIDAVCARVVSPDGTPKNNHGLDIGVKDALNMSMKVISMLVKDLPKVITLARVQRLEMSLMKVVESLPRDKQDEVLLLLEEEERKAVREAK
jgi:hypothetical protein